MKNNLIRLLEKISLLALVAFLFVVPFHKLTVKILLSIGFVSLILLNILKYKSKFYRELIPNIDTTKFLLLFFIAAAFSALFSLNPYYSQQILFQRHLPYVIVFCMGYAIVNNSFRNLYVLIVSFLLLSMVIGVGATRDFFIFQSDRLSRVFGKGIFMSAFLPFLLPLNLAMFTSVKQKLLRILSLTNVLILIPVAIWTNERLIWVSTAAALLFILVINFKKTTILLLCFLIAMIMVMTPQLGKDRARSLLHPFSNMGDRADLMKASVDIFMKYPISGAGLGMFKHLYSPRPGYEKLPTYNHSHVHSDYLEVAADMGSFGLAAFLGIFITFFALVLKKIKIISIKYRGIYIGLLSSIFAVLVACLGCTLITVGMQAAVLFWFFLGICVNMATSQYYQQESPLTNKI
jgi:O-antigen ligase